MEHSSSQESGLEDITEDELLRLAWEHHALDLHTSIPARVDSYDAGGNGKPPTVKVTILVNRAVHDGDGNYIAERLPQLADVPVLYPRTKKFFCVFPLEAGDTGLLVFSEANIASWRSTGSQSDPGDVARHTLDGAVFAPGLYDDKNGTQTAIGSNMLIGRDGTASAQIEITDTEIHLGAGASKQAARKGDNLNASTSLKAWASTVEGALNGLGAPIAPLFSAGPGLPGGLGDINQGSSKVKVED